MGLYNMIHGFNDLAGVLVQALRLYPPSINIDRFLNAALYNKDMPEGEYLIRITTRTGGPNREIYKNGIERLIKHEYFLREENETSDPTYMYFFFKIPPDLVKDIAIVEDSNPGKLSSVVDNQSLEEKMF